MLFALLVVYLVVINVVTGLVYAEDKRRARRGARRFSEASLLALAAIGGGLGAWIAMYVCHHKTRKLHFSVGVPAMLAVWLVILGLAHFFLV